MTFINRGEEAENKKWVMPEWMEQYRNLIDLAGYGSAEEAMNAAQFGAANTIVSGQIFMLLILQKRRLLKSMPKLARAKKNDPQTSHDAADGVNITKGMREAIRVINYLYNFIDDELIVTKNELKSPLSDSGIKTRRSELVALGYVADTGLKRLTKYGNKAIVWNITQSGKALAASVMASHVVASEMNAGMTQ